MSAPSYPEGVLQSRAGKIRGDDADQWLREHDPRQGRQLHRPSLLPPPGTAWIEALQTVEVPPAQPWHPAVYFVRIGQDGPIKIGFCMNARSVGQRVALLQTASPEPLHLLRAVYGKRIIESRLHRYFAEHRIRGEWFAATDELLKLATA